VKTLIERQNTVLAPLSGEGSDFVQTLLRVNHTDNSPASEHESCAASSGSRGEVRNYVVIPFDSRSFIPYYGAFHEAFKRRHSVVNNEAARIPMAGLESLPNPQ
jgi:hypothetical protein